MSAEENRCPQLSSILAGKSWFGFDLDDTLHDFRIASAAAADSVMTTISYGYQVPLSSLKDEYARVVKQKTADAFADGKTSFDYRKERFILVLTHFDLPLNEPFLAYLLDSYETTLMNSLRLKSGALELFSLIKRKGKKIVVITEGPQDAQERTIQRLGLAPYIDFLATTNHFGVAKVDGLFAKVLDHLGITADEMVYTGDNELRDVKPAMAEGIFSIHLAEDKPTSLNTIPLQINALETLASNLLETEEVAN